MHGRPRGHAPAARGTAAALLLVLTTAACSSSSSASPAPTPSGSLLPGLPTATAIEPTGVPTAPPTPVASATSDDTGYLRFTNTRFGFSVEVPESFDAGSVPAGGDGVTFSSGKARVVAYGSGNADGLTPQTALDRALAQGRDDRLEVDEQSLTGDVVVLSGTADGKYTFLRQVVTPQTVQTLLWSMPARSRDTYRRFVEHSVESFTTGTPPSPVVPPPAAVRR